MKFEELLEAEIKRIDEDLDLVVDVARAAFAGLVGLTAGLLWMNRDTRRKMERAHQRSPVAITAQTQKEICLAMGLKQHQYELLAMGEILNNEMNSYIDTTTPEGDDLANFAASAVSSVLSVATRKKIPQTGIVQKSDRRLIQQLGGDLGEANLIAAHVFMMLMDDAKEFTEQTGVRSIDSYEKRNLQKQLENVISDMKRQRLIV